MVKEIVCIKDCEKGRREFERLMDESDSIFDAAQDFKRFVITCCNQGCDKLNSQSPQKIVDK